MQGPPEPAASGPPELRTVALLKDPCPGFGRTAHYLSWHPDGGRCLAVAYCIMVSTSLLLLTHTATHKQVETMHSGRLV